jgi:glycosyltransferase involved in cell wall biosynthesis
MNEQPLVSVVIPAWNHADTLGACLASIEAQTYRPLEVIVVDDGSADATAARFAERVDAAVPYQFIRLPENRGAPAARNVGATQASGEFLLFVDADAVLIPQAIERMVRTILSHPNARFAYSSFRFGWKTFPCGPFDLEAVRKSPQFHTTSLLRRSAFPGFDESLKKFQDWDLWLTVIEQTTPEHQPQAGVWIAEELFQIKVRKEGMSRWFPSIVHRLPWPMFGWMPQEIRRYREWKAVVLRKHQLTS